MLKRRLHRLVCVYTYQNATLLEITCCGSYTAQVFVFLLPGWRTNTKQHHMCMCPFRFIMRCNFVFWRYNQGSKGEKAGSGFIQASKCKIQGLFKDFSRTSKRLSYHFQGLKTCKNTNLHINFYL